MSAGKGMTGSCRSSGMRNQMLICGRVPYPHFDHREIEDYNVVTLACQGKAREGILLKRPTLLLARISSSAKSAI